MIIGGMELSEEEFGWVLATPMEGIEGDNHIVPGADLRCHMSSDVCWCNLTLIDHPQIGLAYQHKALDNREVYFNGKKTN